MTPVGHTLMGLALGHAATPRGWSTRAHAGVLATFAVLANLPDAPLPGWGHDAYAVSHSLLVTTLAAGGLAVALAVKTALPGRLLAAGVAAWCSHLLLDTLYNHGQGLAVWWPVSDARLALPVPWFSTMRLDPLVSLHNLRVFAIELLCYAPLLLGVAWRQHRRNQPRHCQPPAP